MDGNGNVIFDNSNPPPNQPQNPPPDQVPPDPTQPPDQNGEQAPSPNVDPSMDPNTPDPTQPAYSPPSGGGNSGLIKKIGIGVGIILFIFIIIYILIPKNNKPKAVTLVWWGLWEDSQVMQPAIADFEKEYPNITVDYVKEDPNQYLDRLTTRIENGTGPDIFRYHNTWYPMLSNDLMPLTTTAITPAAFSSEYYPVMQKDLIQNGAIYGIPLDADSLALYVNTDLLSAAGVSPPQTWDDFVNDAKKLTVKDSSGKIETAGAAMGTYDNIEHAPDIISLLLVEQGVNLFQFPSDPTPETTAFNFYLSFAQGGQNVWDDTLNNSLLAFSKGTLAMYIGYSWDVLNLQQMNPALHFKVYPLPSLYSTKGTIASYWVEGVSAKTQNQQAAMEFMNFLTQKSTLQELYTQESKVRSFGEPYPRVDMADSLKSNPLVYPFVSQLPYASSSYFASDTDDGENGLNTLSNTYLENFINSINNDNGSMQSALPTLDNGIAQVFQKYGIQ